MDPQNRSGRGGKEKIFMFLPGIEPWSSSLSCYSGPVQIKMNFALQLFVKTTPNLSLYVISWKSSSFGFGIYVHPLYGFI